ncbi:MAG: hypothetical protein ABJO30_04100 [Hyphomicrobiales bacterium]
MSLTTKIEREVAVMSCWTVFGILGLGFLLEGGVRDNFLVGVFGIGAFVVGFLCHLVANYVFKQSFSKGEVALGLGVFVTSTIVFIVGWLSGSLSETSFFIGLTALSIIVAGFIVNLTTRYGVSGAFHKFDVSAKSHSRHRK